MVQTKKTPVADPGAVSAADKLMDLATQIVAAYMGNHKTPPTEIPKILKIVHESLTHLKQKSITICPTSQKPAVSIKDSVQDDYIVCLEDGQKLKILKRYLRTHFGMTPEEYRMKWNLPMDYPMVAPNYTKQRSRFAKAIGLGHHRIRRARKGRATKSTAH